MIKEKLEDYVVSIPDFPEPGIIFRDITSVLQDADGLRMAIDSMQKLVEGLEYDVIAGAESRGFIFGTPIAYNMHKPFALVRKKGKLPRETVETSYDLEYGSATIEMHKDSIQPGQKVLVVDDLIATGGTLEATIKLVEQLGGEVVGVLVLMELKGLHGRDRIKCPVYSAIQYEGK
ncbi:MAG: adenine phosphoribosyltransferase [Lachnospiraceae bacterium]|nr:adenine phosphoribosyltransferase [Lachnospiraceae bacterium]